MRVLITDFLAESDCEREVLPGVEVDALLSLIGHPPTPADLVRSVGERPAAVLITWYEMFFDATTLAALSRAGVVGIVRAGVGFDNIDLVGARAAGITVCNVPDYGTDEVADHAMALLLWCLRCLRDASPTAASHGLPASQNIRCRNALWLMKQAEEAGHPISMREAGRRAKVSHAAIQHYQQAKARRLEQGGLPEMPPTAAPPTAWWDAARFASILRLQECTLGLLGFGRIGQATARRAQSFGLNVRWYDPYVPRGQDKVTCTTRVENLPDLLQDCDALSIHCSLNHETRHMIDAAALALLPPHAVVINTARGPVIDEQALFEALRAGRLAAAALDVLQHEPPVENALFDAYLRGELQNLLLTPHIAWYSQQSVRELRRKAAEEAGRLLRGEPPYNIVT